MRFSNNTNIVLTAASRTKNAVPIIYELLGKMSQEWDGVLQIVMGNVWGKFISIKMSITFYPIDILKLNPQNALKVFSYQSNHLYNPSLDTIPLHSLTKIRYSISL